MAELLTGTFLAALLITSILRLWLAARQIRHVREHRDSVPPRFADSISNEAHARAADYTIAKMQAAIAGVLVDAAAAAVLTVGGGLQFLWNALAAHFSGLPLGVFFLAGLFVIVAAADLPLSVYRQFGIEARFGFNRMTPGLFAADLAKQTVIAAAIGLPALFVVLWLMESAGGYWWGWVWIFWAAFNLLLIWAYPAWIAPLFNRFTPLDDPELKSRVETLLARCGFASGGIFVVDGSRRSAHGNAYFTGFGDNKRIVFFDTLLDRLGPGEIEAVLAHELGHFRHHHVARRIALSFSTALAFLWLLAQAIATPWFYSGLGVESPSTAMALALFFVVLPIFVFPVAPISSALSRRHEFEADRYAAANASADALTSALVKLYEDNAATLTPDPLYSRFHDSHPTAVERVGRLELASRGGTVSA